MGSEPKGQLESQRSFGRVGFDPFNDLRGEHVGSACIKVHCGPSVVAGEQGNPEH